MRRTRATRTAVSDLKKIHSAGTHLLSLINDVLDLAKIEAGKMDLYLETFEVPGMVNDVVTTIDTLVKKNGNQLRVEIDAGIGEMRADITKVRQALFNLLSNAAKFTHEGVIGLVVQGRRDDWRGLGTDVGVGLGHRDTSRIRSTTCSTNFRRPTTPPRATTAAPDSVCRSAVASAR